jgi:hypothetical protein
MDKESLNNMKVEDFIGTDSQADLIRYFKSIDAYTKKIYIERISALFQLLNDIS